MIGAHSGTQEICTGAHRGWQSIQGLCTGAHRGCTGDDMKRQGKAGDFYTYITFLEPVHACSVSGLRFILKVNKWNGTIKTILVFMESGQLCLTITI